MFKVEIDPLLETCENLKVLSMRLEQETENLKSIASALYDLSYLEEQTESILKRQKRLNENEMQLGQMKQALANIAECYRRSEERVITEYESPKPPFTAEPLAGRDLRPFTARLKQLDII